MANLLELHGITKRFGDVTILRDIDLQVPEGQSVAIVGESGCGKTTLGKIIADVWPASSGQVIFGGRDVAKMSKAEYRDFRLKVQMVQQDSFAALNPYKSIYHSISAALKAHKFVRGETAARERVAALLTDVGLTPTEHFIDKYPHQLSGGQRQRVLIARALGVDPRLIVADEPVSMVDVSLRISLLQLMRGMSDKYGVSFVYITHDLATARYVSEHGQLVVMYLGKIVEMNNISSAVRDPHHPYFRALVKAVPEGLPTGSGEAPALPLKGAEVPDVTDIPKGCSFHPRCLYSTERCQSEVPELRPVGAAQAACWNLESVRAAVAAGRN
ncbi:MAG: ABC transporter ATP-binding protein [Candidatus Nanopelagicales bacterium]